MPLRSSIRDPSTNPPKTMFQLSGFTVRWFEGSGFRVHEALRVESRAPKKHISIRIGISHMNPLIMKPNKVGISL